MSTPFCALVIAWLMVMASSPAASSQVLEIKTAPLIANLFERTIGVWQLVGPVNALLPAELAAYDPSRGGIVREYGLRQAAFANYTDGQKATIRMEVFQMLNYVSAYGIYSCERTSPVRVDSLGTEATMGSDYVAFWKGDYYVRLSMVKNTKGRNVVLGQMTDLAKAISAKLAAGPSELPRLVQHLPADGLAPGTERFIAGPLGLAKFSGYDNPADMFNLDSEGVEAAIADYKLGEATGKLLLVEYHTPQLAGPAFEKISQYFQGLPQSERDRRVLKREGNFIIEAFGVTDHPMMEKIVNAIRYTAKVRWLDDKKIRLVSPFPEFSPVKWLIGTFIFIGVIALIVTGGGILIGYAFFRWRRRQIQRFGFSDAGGMVRLNLDQLILPPTEPPPKSLPKGG